MLCCSNSLIYIVCLLSTLFSLIVILYILGTFMALKCEHKSSKNLATQSIHIGMHIAQVGCSN